mmetsp:Transcript_22020/g.61629  ORF Transcript_22020/g.61629 Transcript_22020/m.61629 type:complete len:213 (+) Transcript_22020:734-1372(+)
MVHVCGAPPGAKVHWDNVCVHVDLAVLPRRQDRAAEAHDGEPTAPRPVDARPRIHLVHKDSLCFPVSDPWAEVALVLPPPPEGQGHLRERLAFGARLSAGVLVRRDGGRPAGTGHGGNNLLIRLLARVGCVRRAAWRCAVLRRPLRARDGRCRDAGVERQSPPERGSAAAHFLSGVRDGPSSSNRGIGGARTRRTQSKASRSKRREDEDPPL